VEGMTLEMLQNVTATNDLSIPPGRLQDALLSNMKLPLRKDFYPLGYSVEILTNEPQVLVAAQECFGHADFTRERTALQIRVGVSYRTGAECPPEPVRRQFAHLYSLVADTENQAVLDLATGTNFLWLTNATVENRLYLRSNFLEKVVYLLLGGSFVTDIHAGCVGKHGKGILLCGDSGAGKSTLAYACARAGWTYTSDDTSYLINNSAYPRVIGHCHRARFRPTAKMLFPELEGHVLSPRMEEKPSIEVPTRELPIQSTSIEAAVHFIVFLNRHPQAKGNLVRLPKGTSTRRIGQELFSAGEIRARHETVLEALADVPTYDLHYHGISDGIGALDSLITNI
jgi:hypothetical protein